MTKYNALIPATLLAGLAVFSACATNAQDHDKGHDKHKGHDGDAKHVNAWKAVTKAVCVIRPTDGNTAKGVVRFTQDGDTVKVEAEISGLKPGAKHGFHIHEYGDLSLGNGTSTGGHYNPDGHDHAGPDKKMRHAGDLGNLTADKDGKAKLSLTLDNLSVAGMKNPVVGRGMIVHEGTDDLKSQPTGAAGARIGHGVIGIAK